MPDVFPRVGGWSALCTNTLRGHVLSSLLANFPLEFFLLLSLESSLHIPGASPLLDMRFVNIFLQDFSFSEGGLCVQNKSF